MNRLAKIISELNKEDLLSIRRDLIAGNIDRLINKRLEQEQNAKNFSEKTCPVCNGEIRENAFILEFGESYLRRRAFFDGIDCLDYFVHSSLRKEVSPKKTDDRDTD
jgi:hypothetical protein